MKRTISLLIAFLMLFSVVAAAEALELPILPVYPIDPVDPPVVQPDPEEPAEPTMPVFDNLGASLRINNTPALRFGMRVEKDAAYKASSDKMKFGMLFIEKNSLTGALTVDTVGAHKEMLTAPLLENSNELVFVYTLDNVTSYTAEYVTRPFIEYKTEDGETLYFYAESKTRSAEYIAETALKSATDTKTKELLNKFIVK